MTFQSSQLLRTGCLHLYLEKSDKQAMPHSLLSKTRANSSSATEQVKLGPRCRCRDATHSTGLTGRQDTASRLQLRAHGNAQGWQERLRHLGAEWVPFTSHPVTRPRQHCQQVWRSWPASQDLDYTPEPKQFTVKPGICNLGEVTGALNPGNFWSKLPVAQFPPATVIKQLRFQPPIPLFNHFPKHLLRPRYFLSNTMNACSDTVPALRAE